VSTYGGEMLCFALLPLMEVASRGVTKSHLFKIKCKAGSNRKVGKLTFLFSKYFFFIWRKLLEFSVRERMWFLVLVFELVLN